MYDICRESTETLDCNPADYPAPTSEYMTRIRSNNPSIARDALSSLMSPLSLSANDAKPFYFQGSAIRLASVKFGFVEYGTDTTLAFEESADHYIIALPLKGRQTLLQNNQSITTESGNGLIFSPTKNAELKLDSAYSGRFVCIKKQSIDLQLSKLINKENYIPVKFDINMSTLNDHGACWWRTIEYLEQEYRCTNALFADSPFTDQVERLIITGLLLCQSHNYSVQLRMNNKAVLPSYVRRAQTFILKHLQDQITCDDIVAAADVPKRTLYAGFRRFLGISPISYLHKTRMESARQELLTSEVDISITNVAMKWQFNHLGRFSTKYKSRFGESPSETLKRSEGLSSICNF